MQGTLQTFSLLVSFNTPALWSVYSLWVHQNTWLLKVLENSRADAQSEFHLLRENPVTSMCPPQLLWKSPLGSYKHIVRYSFTMLLPFHSSSPYAVVVVCTLPWTFTAPCDHEGERLLLFSASVIWIVFSSTWWVFQWYVQLMISILTPILPLTVYTYDYLKAENLICWHVNLETCLL